MGGIGKTELALQYALAKREGKEYQGGICWLEARDEDLATQLVNTYARIELNLNPPDDFNLEQRVKWVWSNWPNEGNILVILDDVTSYESIETFLPNDPKFKIIITTRLQSIAQELKELD